MLHDVNDVHFINLCHVIKQFRLQLVLQQIVRAGSPRYDVLFTCNVDKDMFCLIYSASPLQLHGISRNFPLGFTGSALSWRKRTCNNLFTHLCFHLCWCLRATKLLLKAKIHQKHTLFSPIGCFWFWVFVGSNPIRCSHSFLFPRYVIEIGIPFLAFAPVRILRVFVYCSEVRKIHLQKL